MKVLLSWLLFAVIVRATPLQAQVITIPSAEYMRLENANYAPSDPTVLHVALVAFSAVQGADLATTMYALGSGRGREANPVFAPFAKSPVAAGAIKMGIAGATGLALWKLHARHPVLALCLTVAGTAGYGAIAVHNARIAAPS